MTLPDGFRAVDPRGEGGALRGMTVRERVRRDVLMLLESGEAAMARDYPDVPSAKRDTQRYRDAVRWYQKMAERRKEPCGLEGVAVWRHDRTMVIERGDAV